MNITAHRLHSSEIVQVRETIAFARAIQACVSDQAFSTRGVIAAQELPRTLRILIRDFIVDDEMPALLLRGNPIEPALQPPTPAAVAAKPLMTDAHVLAGLYTSLTGELFAYSSQHGGRLFNDIIAIKAQAEISNSSAGSDFAFDFHTEDAFHDFCPDYLGLCCIRNEERAVTQLACLPLDSLPRATIELLMRETVAMLPNALHVAGGAVSRGRFPILSGDPVSPYIRLNINAFDARTCSTCVCEAIDELVARIRLSSFPIVLESGDFLLLNNRKALHRRDPYRPRYDGQSRWLVRAISTSDIRVSRQMRDNPKDRILKG
jgi:hypothetical protein